MAELTGSEIIARCLQKEGIRDLFFIMGGPMLLAEATCIKEGIRMIDVRHEQAAAFACQAYSRLLQEPSVCMAASGPGVTNAQFAYGGPHFFLPANSVSGGAGVVRLQLNGDGEYVHFAVEAGGQFRSDYQNADVRAVFRISY